MKSGWKTTEFWKSLIMALIILAVGFGWLGPDFADKYQAQIESMAFLATALLGGSYSVSRAVAKSKTSHSTTDVTVTNQETPSTVVTEPQADEAVSSSDVPIDPDYVVDDASGAPVGND